MRKDYEKLFTYLRPEEPPVGLFDRIILAIKQEQELQKTRRLLFSFFSLLTLSLIGAPFSFTFFLDQVESSGILYFISTAFGNLGTFLALWPDSILAILESLPIMGIVAFMVNMALALFTLRLFLYRKRLLLNRLIHYYEPE